MTAGRYEMADDDLSRQRRKRDERLLAQAVPGAPDLTVGDLVADVLAATAGRDAPTGRSTCPVTWPSGGTTGRPSRRSSTTSSVTTTPLATRPGAALTTPAHPAPSLAMGDPRRSAKPGASTP